MDNHLIFKDSQAELLSHLVSAGVSSLLVYQILLKKCGISHLECMGIASTLKSYLDDLFNESDYKCVNKTFPQEAFPQEVSDSLQNLDLYLLKNDIRSYFPNSLRREVALRRRELSNAKKALNDDMLYFSDIDQPFGEFSNFSNHAIYLETVIWQTVEHYYQATKYSDLAIKNQIRLAASPVLAKDISRHYSQHIDSNWTMKKEEVMLKAVNAKFHQHPELKSLLVSTKNITITELSKNDSFWGDPGDGSGDNKLGVILMSVREKLKQEVL